MAQWGARSSTGVIARRARPRLLAPRASGRTAHFSGASGRFLADETESGDSGNVVDLHEVKRRKRYESNARKVPRWPGWIFNTDGTLRAVVANALVALRNSPEWRGVLGYNQFAEKIAVLKAPPWQNGVAGQPWDDASDVQATDWLQHHGVMIPVRVASDAVMTVARDNPFHPVKDYLDSLIWDGVNRTSTWLTDFLGASSSDYTKSAATCWLISAVARIYRPGCKVDSCLILEGEQGTKKSSAFRVLGSPWFTDDLADLGSKDSAMQLLGAWIVELSELDSMQRGELSKIKAFMSRETDRFRPPYGRHVIEAPRQCTFCGTVNHNDYLRDETGSRRFWPVTVGEAKLASLTDARDQLWAQARDQYLAGEVWWIETKRALTQAREAQFDAFQADPWQGHINRHLLDREQTTVADILRMELDRKPGDWTQTDMNRIARCLRVVGWKRFQEREEKGGGRKWVYRPTKEDEGTDSTVTTSISTGDETGDKIV